MIYQTEAGKSHLEVKFQDETLWLNFNQLSQLLVETVCNFRHLKNIFKEEELNRNAVVEKIATAALDNKVYQVEYFNLEVVISVGYRVKYKRGTQFRIWATQTLKDHLIKGYTINEKRLQEQQEKLKELNLMHD